MAIPILIEPAGIWQIGCLEHGAYLAVRHTPCRRPRLGPTRRGHRVRRSLDADPKPARTASPALARVPSSVGQGRREDRGRGRGAHEVAGRTGNDRSHGGAVQLRECSALVTPGPEPPFLPTSRPQGRLENRSGNHSARFIDRQQRSSLAEGSSMRNRKTVMRRGMRTARRSPTHPRVVADPCSRRTAGGKSCGLRRRATCRKGGGVPIRSGNEVRSTPPSDQPGKESGDEQQMETKGGDGGRCDRTARSARPPQRGACGGHSTCRGVLSPRNGRSRRRVECECRGRLGRRVLPRWLRAAGSAHVRDDARGHP